MNDGIGAKYSDDGKIFHCLTEKSVNYIINSRQDALLVSHSHLEAKLGTCNQCSNRSFDVDIT
jgi:hypothetical protein